MLDYMDLDLDEQLKAPKLFTASKTIKRFSEYKLLWDPVGLFIVPADNATEIVDPAGRDVFDFYPDILLEFIEMSQVVMKFHDEWVQHRNAGIYLKSIGSHILNFCNKYGLFNLSGSYVVALGTIDDTRGAVSYDKRIVSLTPMGRAQLSGFVRNRYQMSLTMSLLDFVNIIYPKSWKGYKGIIREDKTGGPHIFNNYHCENLGIAQFEITRFYKHFKEWNEFQSGGFDPFDTVKIMEGVTPRERELIWHQHLSSGLRTESVRLSLIYKRGWRFQWRYDSLIDALKIMFMNNILESNKSIRLCENCDTAFIANKKNQIYCNKYCNDAARSRRYYDTHKKKTREN